MSNEIKELVKRLRVTYLEEVFSLNDVLDAANSLEAMIGELEAYESARVTWMTMMREWINRAVAAEAECDRLKAALEGIARNADESTDLPLFRVQCRDFAREALEGRE